MTSKTHSFFSQIRMLAAEVYARLGWRLGLLVVLMVVVALSEGISMVLLLPLLNAVGVSGETNSGFLGGILENFLSLTGLENSPYGLAGIILIAFGFQLSLFLVQSWWVSWAQRDFGAFWQKRLLDSFLHAKWSFISEQKLGNMTNLITMETIRIAGAVQILLQSIATLVTSIIYIVVACLISLEVTVLMVGFALVIFISVRGLGRKNYQIGLRLGPLASELNVLLTEFLGGIKLIKATATEDAVTKQAGEVIDDLRLQHTWATFLPMLVRAIFEFSAIAGLCFLLVFGYRTLEIPAASMLVVLALFVRLLPRFNALQQNMQLLATYIPAFSEVRRVVNLASEHAETRVLGSGSMGHMSGALNLDIKRAGYRGQTTLQDVVLRFPETGAVGIVGESGSGKTTLVNCLFGFAEIEDGRVSFGKTAMDSVSLLDWRRQIGYVPQETVLFHRSIRDNIAWGADGATDEDIEQAARHALAHDFILEQPQGYDTIIGDQGARLSGGQRQRLGIARALLAHPRLLVMDEATSALDSTSEAAVLETVAALRKEICVVMVAHRLSTVRDVDMIAVMNRGRVVETGSWDDLRAKGGTFSKLVSVQNI